MIERRVPSRHDRGRRGFTLLELMLALTLTAIAAGIAGTTLTAARRTAETIQAQERTGDAEARLRALLVDMLRHAPPATVVGREADRGDGLDRGGTADRDERLEALLQITPTAHGQQLMFLSRGVEAPYGTGPVWQVTVESDGDSLWLEAQPLDARETAARGGAARAVLRASVPRIAQLEVAVLEPATALGGVRWRRDWPLAQSRPAAVSLTWSTDRTAAPFVVALDALSAGAP